MQNSDLMSSCKSITPLLMDQFPIAESGRPELVKWESRMKDSSIFNLWLYTHEWQEEVAKLWNICQKHSYCSKHFPFDPAELFPEIVEEWRQVLLGRQDVMIVKRPMSLDLGKMLIKYLNLETNAKMAIHAIEYSWKSSVSTGTPLKVMIDVIRRKCRTLSARGYYDPHGQLENLVEVWYHSIHDEHAFNTVLSVVQTVLCQ